MKPIFLSKEQLLAQLHAGDIQLIGIAVRHPEFPGGYPKSQQLAYALAGAFCGELRNQLFANDITVFEVLGISHFGSFSKGLPDCTTDDWVVATGFISDEVAKATEVLRTHVAKWNSMKPTIAAVFDARTDQWTAILPEQPAFAAQERFDEWNPFNK